MKKVKKIKINMFSIKCDQNHCVIQGVPEKTPVKEKLITSLAGVFLGYLVGSIFEGTSFINIHY